MEEFRKEGNQGTGNGYLDMTASRTALPDKFCTYFVVSNY
jgi:hypothetical protein